MIAPHDVSTRRDRRLIGSGNALGGISIANRATKSHLPPVKGAWKLEGVGSGSVVLSKPFDVVGGHGEEDLGYLSSPRGSAISNGGGGDDGSLDRLTASLSLNKGSGVMGKAVCCGRQNADIISDRVEARATHHAPECKGQARPVNKCQ